MWFLPNNTKHLFKAINLKVTGFMDFISILFAGLFASFLSYLHLNIWSNLRKIIIQDWNLWNIFLKRGANSYLILFFQNGNTYQVKPHRNLYWSLMTSQPLYLAKTCSSRFVCETLWVRSQIFGAFVPNAWEGRASFANIVLFLLSFSLLRKAMGREERYTFISV